MYCIYCGKTLPDEANFAIAVVNPFGLTISKNLKDWKNQK